MPDLLDEGRVQSLLLQWIQNRQFFSGLDRYWEVDALDTRKQGFDCAAIEEVGRVLLQLRIIQSPPDMLDCLFLAPGFYQSNSIQTGGLARIAFTHFYHKLLPDSESRRHHTMAGACWSWLIQGMESTTRKSWLKSLFSWPVRLMTVTCWTRALSSPERAVPCGTTGCPGPPPMPTRCPNWGLECRKLLSPHCLWWWVCPKSKFPWCRTPSSLLGRIPECDLTECSQEMTFRCFLVRKFQRWLSL